MQRIADQDRKLDDAQSRVRQSFHRGLATYHSAAVAQAQIAAILVDALQAAGAPANFGRALEFGCGTGHLTAQILQRFRLDHLMVNDLVPDCAAVLQPILQAHKTQVTFHAGAIETLPLPMGLDLVASASTVQWVQDPAALICRLTTHLAPGGWIAISGYGRDHFAEIQALEGRAKAPSYLDPDDWRALLPTNLRLCSVARHSLPLQFPDGVSLLRHLRRTGVNAVAGRQWTRANLVDFENGLRAARPNTNDLSLTYSPVIIVAKRVG